MPATFAQKDQKASARAAAKSVAGVWVERPGGHEDKSVVLYVYGGTFVFNSGPMHIVIAEKIAMHGRARVLLCDYRLAPEHPFPLAIEDVACAYEALLEQGEDPRNITFVGDTTGAGIALAALLMLRDRQVPMPAGYVALCPVVDLTFSGGSYVRNFRNDEKVSELEIFALLAIDYLQGADPRDPLASPLFADLGGLPEMQIHVDVNEVHCDDGVMLAERLRECGCRVALHQWDGLPSTWQKLAPLSTSISAVLARIGQFVRSQCPTPGIVSRDEAVADEFVNIFDGHIQPHMMERVKQIMDWSVDHGPDWVWPFMERRLGHGSLVTQEQCEREWLYMLFARSRDAIFLLSSSKHLLLANGMANALFKKGGPLVQRYGRLQGASGDLEALLQQAFVDLVPGGDPISFSLDCVNGDRVFARLERLSFDGGDVVAPPVALLTIMNTKKEVVVDEEALRAWFGLSRREARLAAAFVRGTGLADYAQKEDLSMNTVRTQFAHIRTKLGAVDQADVVRLILQVST